MGPLYLMLGMVAASALLLTLFVKWDEHRRSSPKTRSGSKR
jgi:hypothetical protein